MDVCVVKKQFEKKKKVSTINVYDNIFSTNSHSFFLIPIREFTLVLFLGQSGIKYCRQFDGKFLREIENENRTIKESVQLIVF